MRPFPHLPAPPAVERVELVLRTPEGTPWVLRVTAGVERFIGCYPRLQGMDAGGPLLAFRTVGAEG